MYRKRNALIIPAPLRQPVRVERIDAALLTMQGLVEGSVEAITWNDWHVYLNDEAGFIPLPMNARAEVLLREAGLEIEQPVSGTAVLLGHDDHGEDVDAPPHMLRLAEQLFDAALAA
ncbi:DUF3846 domain-containing protein [Paenarthrobacter sp. RAF54_2]|uniref:DUF3846 domain-containing protein n=1 Tax=Paenarthrobacter sp. RAF54_2 TaxID=3233061 RepID=UPI003F9BBA7E